MNNAERILVAEETLRVLQAGQYPYLGQTVPLPDLTPMLSGTRLHTPQDAPTLLGALAARRGSFLTQVQVTEESTFQAARRLRERYGQVAALNFASARKPGGGFLTGALSQEEDLARCSGLYLSLTQPAAQGYYRTNMAEGSALYTHHLIYSPEVPVFRGEGAAFLPAPVTVNVITAPAPNAGAVAQNDPRRLPDVQPTLRERAALVLGVAAAHEQTHLVLGAWGCGVFRNDPVQVAGVFRDLLAHEAQGAFETVVFAVLDRQPSQAILRAFQETFG